MSATDHPRIELRLRDLAQLFNSFDPSPFMDRDLDPNAEEFILSWAREIPVRRDVELRIHLATPPDPERLGYVQDAVRHYFSYRAGLKQKELRQLMRRGRISLAVGVVFLSICMLLAEFAYEIADGAFAEIAASSVTIVGWVAMWRPMEIYLYGWWPIWEERRRLERLARMKVKVVVPQGEKTTSG